MKRLVRKSSRKRLFRTIIAEWQTIDAGGSDTIQTITNAMENNEQIQIEYEGSGWRLITPYGWNTSKEGNMLLMCYKDTGEVRSYRFDRIQSIMVDDSLLVDQDDNNPNGLLIRDYDDIPEEYQIPTLPNMDEIIEQTESESGNELPFNEALDYLTQDFGADNLQDNDMQQYTLDDNVENIDVVQDEYNQDMNNDFDNDSQNDYDDYNENAVEEYNDEPNDLELDHNQYDDYNQQNMELEEDNENGGENNEQI